jgi:hypothetical protein
MNADDFLEKVESIFTNLVVWEVSERTVASVADVKLLMICVLFACTYGHDMIETTAIPITIALLTLYDMRYAVNMPPHNKPIQS